MARSIVSLGILLLCGGPLASPALAQRQPTATVHAALPASASDLWLVPADGDFPARSLTVYRPLVDGVAAFADGKYEVALPLVSRTALRETPLGDYAAYYTAATLARLSRTEDARAGFHALRERKPKGQLAGAAALGEAAAAEVLGDYRAAAAIYRDLVADKLTLSDTVLSSLGRAELAAGNRSAAADAYARVYYEFPLTDSAVVAATALDALRAQWTADAYPHDLGRAQILFGAGRYKDARAAFAALVDRASGDDREVVALRLAESDYHLGRYAAAQNGLRPWLTRGARQAEARFFYANAFRGLKRPDDYVAATRELVAAFPDSTWAEDALNNLGTHYILIDEDALAAETFRELYERFPAGGRAERAAWKYGWWQYKQGQYADTVRVFESAAVSFPRGDYRPSFLYWAARAHGRLGNASAAEARLRLVYTDYGNSYYGRLAADRLARNKSGALTDAVPAASRTPEPPPTLPTEPTIRLLLAAGLYDDALAELRYAQRAFGSSTPLEATIAWVYNQKGELRRGITLMRRAYPQHMTAAGQQVPPEILEVIFPLTYWDQIRKHATARNLDPYLVAALINQESTFDADVRSSANAWGLMQILPSTGRRLARSLGIRRFTTRMLTTAETNIRLGTLYFSNLTEQFGGAHYALASYNAGENRVVRWKAERPGFDEDEFIDDIPFPETQNYVKRILGTAEDYRMLYGEGGGGRPIPVRKGEPDPTAR
jgi:peptidoglycan lytic transglycosylase